MNDEAVVELPRSEVVEGPIGDTPLVVMSNSNPKQNYPQK
jgi:hypothetical protein